MKILLIGEYSNVHWTLAQGLRVLGHSVTVVSNGDYWKNYDRDINVERHSGLAGTVCFISKLLYILPQLRGYDVVQLINPCFLDIKAKKLYYIYRFLKRFNKRIYLAAFGMDYYWVNACMNTKTFRYSDFKIGDNFRNIDSNISEINAWTNTAKERLNKIIAQECDGIIAGLYEYYASYEPIFNKKCIYIPFPINAEEISPKLPKTDSRIKFFIGINKQRSQYKGTDIMLRALQRIYSKYSDKCEIFIAESVTYKKYQIMMSEADVILDQLYGYSPAMNALVAMAKGIVVVGGAEEEYYKLQGENELKPIINVQPNEDDVYNKLEYLVLNNSAIPVLSQESKVFIEKYHNHVNIAKQYVDFWTRDY